METTFLTGYYFALPSSSPSTVEPSSVLESWPPALLPAPLRNHPLLRPTVPVPTLTSPTIHDVLPLLRNYLRDALPLNVPLLPTDPLLESIPLLHYSTFPSSSSSPAAVPLFLVRCGVVLSNTTVLEYGSHGSVSQALASILSYFPPQRLQAWLNICLNYCAFPTVRHVLVPPLPSRDRTLYGKPEQEYTGWRHLHNKAVRNNRYLSNYHNRLVPWQQLYLGSISILALYRRAGFRVRLPSLPYEGNFGFTFDIKDIPLACNVPHNNVSAIRTYLDQALQELVDLEFFTKRDIIIQYILIPSPIDPSSYRIILQRSPVYLTPTFVRFLQDACAIMFGNGFGSGMVHALRHMIVQLGGLSRVPFPKEPEIPFSFFVDYIQVEQVRAACIWCHQIQNKVSEMENSGVPIESWSIWKIHRLLHYVIYKPTTNKPNSTTNANANEKKTAYQWRKAYPHDEPYIFGPVIEDTDDKTLSSSASSKGSKRTVSMHPLLKQLKLDDVNDIFGEDGNDYGTDGQQSKNDVLSSSSTDGFNTRDPPPPVPKETFTYKYSLPYGTYGLRKPLPHQTELLRMYEHEHIQYRVNPVVQYILGIYTAGTCMVNYCNVFITNELEGELSVCKYWDEHTIEQINPYQNTSSSSSSSSSSSTIHNNSGMISPTIRSLSRNPNPPTEDASTVPAPEKYSILYHVLTTCQIFHFLLKLNAEESKGSLYIRRFAWIQMLQLLISVNALRLAYHFIDQARDDPFLRYDDTAFHNWLLNAEEQVRNKVTDMGGCISGGILYYERTNIKSYGDSKGDSSQESTGKKRKSITATTSRYASGHETTPQKPNVEISKVTTVTIQVERCAQNVQTSRLRRLKYSAAHDQLSMNLLASIPDVYGRSNNRAAEEEEENDDDDEEDEQQQERQVATIDYEDTIAPTLIQSPRIFSPSLLEFTVGRRRVYYWCYDGLPGTVERIAGERLIQFSDLKEVLRHSKVEAYIQDHLKQMILYQPPLDSLSSIENRSSSASSSSHILQHLGPVRGLHMCLAPSLGAITGYPDFLTEEIPVFMTQMEVNGIDSPGSLKDNRVWVREEKIFISPPAPYSASSVGRFGALSSAAFRTTVPPTSSTYLRSCHGENYLWNTLFSLFVLPAATSQFEHFSMAKHPWVQYMGFSDFNYNVIFGRDPHRQSPAFPIAKNIKQFTGCQLAQHVRSIHDSLYGTRISHGRWDYFSVQNLMDIVHSAGGTCLSAILSRMVNNLEYTCFGLPDLVVWDSAPCVNGEGTTDHACCFAQERANGRTVPHLALMEVKSENDRIKMHQYIWLRHLTDHGVPAAVVHVRSAENMLKTQRNAPTTRKRNYERMKKHNVKHFSFPDML